MPHPASTASTLPRSRRVVDLLLATLAATVSAAGLVVGLIDGQVASILGGLFSVTSAAVAGLLGLRLAREAGSAVVGRRLLLIGLSSTLLVSVDVFVDYGLTLGATDEFWFRLAADVADFAWALTFWALAALLWVFPDGRPPTRRLGPAGRWTGRALAALLVFRFLFSDDVAAPDGQPVANPFGLSPPTSGHTLFTVLFVGLLLTTLVGGAWSVRWRLKHSTGIERLQLWWVAYAGSLVPIALISCLVELTVFKLDVPIVAGVFVALLPIAIPVAVAVAILRYRLYAIDRLINRTAVYALLTLVLAGLYVAAALLAGLLVGGGRLPTAIATLAVAVAFRPARERAQRAIDRRFHRRRYAGLRRVEQFGEDVRAGKAEPERIGEVLANALGDRGLEVLFWLPASERYAHPRGHFVDQPAPRADRALTPITRGELQLGMLVHDPALALTPDTLDSVLRSAGLAIEIARLRVEIRVQLAEVEASRARIVLAAEAERHRLERDLHDGAQQRLVSLGLAVRHAQHLLAHSERDDTVVSASAALDGAVAEVTAAIGELRELARGLRPALLDHGLEPALADLARRSPIPVQLSVRTERVSPPIEAAAFYVACEALTNAVKHADARQMWVTAELRGGDLRIEVRDDGIGGAAASPGGGLAGLSDRVAARGGRLQLVSPKGAGTRVLAHLPCPA